jgi:hypothetical protein
MIFLIKKFLCFCIVLMTHKKLGNFKPLEFGKNEACPKFEK